MTTDEPALVVTQKDFEAALASTEWTDRRNEGRTVLWALCQTFARHRLTTERTVAAETAQSLVDALREQTDLVGRLCDAVDREADDIGGESSLSVLQMLGPQHAKAIAALDAANPFTTKDMYAHRRNVDSAGSSNEHRDLGNGRRHSTLERTVAAGSRASAEAMRDAADLLEQYASFIRSDVKADDLERHPYLPLIEQTLADLRALPLPAPEPVSGDARAVEALREALKPFARLAGPINGEDGRPTYLEAISGPNGTDELLLTTYVGDGTRQEVLDADDFRRARAALAQQEAGHVG